MCSSTGAASTSVQYKTPATAVKAKRFMVTPFRLTYSCDYARSVERALLDDGIDDTLVSVGGKNVRGSNRFDDADTGRRSTLKHCCHRAGSRRQAEESRASRVA